jgi:DNA-binding LytR/AlgR family response regulator
MMEYMPTLALWDEKPDRATVLKELLDMFASDNKETVLLPMEPELPIEHNDVVFLSFDKCGEPILRVARTVRQSSDITFLVLVAGRNCDFTPFFRPKIRPGGILFRPVETSRVRDLLEEVAEELDISANDGNDDVFILKTEGVTRRILFKDILFFEAVSKKIVLHTTGQEICYYDSIDKLSDSLPSYFVRCHRSYIANVRKIDEMSGKDMELSLIGGYRVPYSRSRRDAVKQAIAI